ncbi:hypothetical protein ABZ905_09240 [Streptomyces parvus]|uniref:hypothetical protein n=1 Tax=Streptomyces parvus TaxID=66428 RepID=UPI0033D4EF06
MAACCGAPRCSCSVIAGPGVTVEGNGSSAAPYVVSSEAGTPTVIQAGDTATIDTTVSGSGTDTDPYVVSADVVLDPSPPGGGDQLLQSGPDGLFLECEQVRTCFSAGDGAGYDPDTGVISARVSADAGNTTSIGTDGGLFTPPGDAVEPTAIEATDSTTVDTEVTGTGTAADPYVVSSSVILDPAPPGGGDQLLQSGPDGLFLECEQVRTCFSAGDGAGYDEATGVITARPSADAGNSLSYGTDGGLLVPPGGADPTAVEGGDSDTVDTEVTGTGTAADPYVVTSSVILDPTPPGGGDQLLQSGPDGLFLECEQVRGCISAGDGAGYDEATGVISARPSTDAGNSLSIGTDGGLLVPPAGDPTAVQGDDSTTVSTTVAGDGTPGDPYIVTAEVILDPAPPGGGDQLLQSGPDGLFLECEQVRGCISAGDGAAYDEATGIISARPSADAGNSLSLGTDGGLLVPTADQLTVGCGLQGEGTPTDPLAAFPIAGERAWSADWSCDAAANSTLRCDPNSGALWTPPEHTSAAVTMQQLHPLGSPAMPATGTTVIIDSTAWSEGAYDADTLSLCRGVTFSVEFTGHAEVSWTAGAIFDLAYAVSVNGGTAASRLMNSVLTPSGPAGRKRATFSVAQAITLPPHTSYRVRVYPAIRVTTGTVTINQWITDTHLIALTR